MLILAPGISGGPIDPDGVRGNAGRIRAGRDADASDLQHVGVGTAPRPDGLVPECRVIEADGGDALPLVPDISGNPAKLGAGQKFRASGNMPFLYLYLYLNGVNAQPASEASRLPGSLTTGFIQMKSFGWYYRTELDCSSGRSILQGFITYRGKMWTSLSIAAGLFWTAFLAATVLPLSSEPALSAAMLADVPPWLCLGAATCGNALGSCFTFFLGRLGSLEWLKRYCRITETEIESARKRIGHYGGVAAFLCFLPIVGDVFAVTLGFMRYSAGRFVILMTLGKFFRYALWMALHQLAVK